MDSKKYDNAILVSKNMIKESEKQLRESIRYEDWTRASDLSSYIAGMNQILTVFELSKE